MPHTRRHEPISPEQFADFDPYEKEDLIKGKVMKKKTYLQRVKYNAKEVGGIWMAATAAAIVVPIFAVPFILLRSWLIEEEDEWD